MNVFGQMEEGGHQQLIFCRDRSTRLRLIIGIHDTTLGPALGGCRMWPYATEEAAVADLLRLSRGMTYKSAASGEDYGGGKAVLWGDPARDKSEALFRALGQFVAGLQGRFITGADVGTTAWDFTWTRQETEHVVALPEAWGGSGDSSLTTAFGVWHGMRACAREVWGDASLAGRTVAIQGVGKVGHHLCRHLHEDGARLVVADLESPRAERAANEFGAQVVDPGELVDVECDIFSPNGLGAVLDDDTIPRLRCRAVAGSANNQLADDLRHAAMLHERGILYAPDYVINAGGLIQVCDELRGFDRRRATARVAGIHEALLRIFAIACQRGINTQQAAAIMVEERLERWARLHRLDLGRGR
ncbi:MAG TPA: leucine dehydrogenase [Clostridiales bacterium UBA8153]|nr:leucine dehydrogenase [Clostridiales bacterium UBA8153]